MLAIALLAIMVQNGIAQSQQLPVNIDQLSDEQLMQYIGMANGSGMSEADIEAKAKQKGLSDDQIQKLKQRIQRLNVSNYAAGSKNNLSDSGDFRKSVAIKKPSSNDYYSSGELRIFGSDLFTKDNLTFEPNLQIPTPRNYLIGTGDQINIDLYGYSDANFKLKVSTEGTIRIPNSGPVKIAGLSFEDAQQKIKSQLAKIYPQIASGKTAVQISLGQIRSIRVTLVGEIRQPGTYTLSSLATIANALYVSGGPNRIGSYRNIELVRNGKIVSTFDLYDFLMKGDLTKNTRLEDEDIIRVSPYEERVYLNGAIKRKAIYEAKKGETLQQLLTIGGGINELGYKDFVRVVRIGKNQKEIITVSADQFNRFLLQSGDSCYIDYVSNRFKNRVMIEGAVFHPGAYSADNYPTLKDLLAIAGITEEAYQTRAILSRRSDNYIPQMMDFNVADILQGKNNITLQKEDAVRIFSIFELKQNNIVNINGEINKPGDYSFIEGMGVNDLVLLAGGLKESAPGSKIEIARRNKDTGSAKQKDNYAIIQVVDIDKNFDKNSSKEFKLEPFDIVSVRKNPNYKEQIKVKIEGEVMYPGEYTLENKSETLTDLIKRAGGFKPTAYVDGAMLLRNTFTDSLDAVLIDDKIQSAKNQTLKADSASVNGILLNSITKSQKIVGIRLGKAIEKPYSLNDISLLEGDILRIPVVPTTVQTFGAVYVPKKVVYRQGLGFKNVVNESGGFLNTASTKKSYVIYPNGEISSTKSFLWFRHYPKITPGAEVYVPLRVKRTTTQEVVAIGSAAASIAAVTVSLIYLIRSF